MSIKINDNVNDTAFDTQATNERFTRAANESVPSTIFQKAVVLEVINDPAAFKNQTDFEKRYTKTNVSNFTFLNRAPRNSLLVRLLNDGQGKRTQQFDLCLPFFPPHLCFPIKPGEHVWLISPAPGGEKGSVNYWMCRVPTWDDVDDINYTHEDRVHHGIPNVPGADASEEQEGEKPKSENAVDPEAFGFPNGTAEMDGFTFGTSENEYTNIVANSLAYKSFKPEPVPRLTKQPGDLVLQGSNNSSITLGTTRGFKGGWAAAHGDPGRILDINDQPLVSKKSSATAAEIPGPPAPAPPEAGEDPTLTPQPDKSKMNPAIDIVVGRGLRIRPGGTQHEETDSATELPWAAGGQSQAPTYPRVKAIVDADGHRGYKSETSKNPQCFEEDIKDNLTDHPIEGDPDFRYDAARIYITAGSNVDKDFGLADGEFVKFSEVANNKGAATEGSSVALKADNVRIIARKDPDDASPTANGSIRLIKEGAPSAATGNHEADKRAVIAIEPDGTIYIDGPKVILGGRSKVAASTGVPGDNADQVFIGEGATQHMLLGDAVIQALTVYSTMVLTAGTQIMACFTPGGSSKGNMGMPVVGGADLSNAVQTLLAAQEALISNLEAARSTVAKIK